MKAKPLPLNDAPFPKLKLGTLKPLVKVTGLSAAKKVAGLV